MDRWASNGGLGERSRPQEIRRVAFGVRTAARSAERTPAPAAGARDGRGICRDGQALVCGGGTAGSEGAVGTAADSGAIRSHDPFRAAQKHRRSPAFRCRSWLPFSPPSPPSSRLLHVRARDARNGSWVCGACVPSSVEDWHARLILDAAQACRPHRSCLTVVRLVPWLRSPSQPKAAQA
jgi:hypothetical protein